MLNILRYFYFGLFFIFFQITFSIDPNEVANQINEGKEVIEENGRSAVRTLRNAISNPNYIMESYDPIYSTCFDVPNSICVGGTTKIITGSSIPEGLVGWWSFDQLYPIDESGYMNNMHKTVRAGPGLLGHGYSASFSQRENAIIKHSKSFETEEFTIAFWIYLLEGPTGLSRNIFSKGTEMGQTPSISLYPNSSRLSVKVSTEYLSSEGLASIGTIILRRWTHVAVTVSEEEIKIFINGKKDNSAKLKGNTIFNKFDGVIGSTISQRGFDGYIDDLRFYNIALDDSMVAALSLPGITGISEHDLVTLGCTDCSKELALSSKTCKEPYHLCSTRELFTGGLHIARINGWLANESDIWNTETIESSIKNEERVALCCLSPNDKQAVQTEEM